MSQVARAFVISIAIAAYGIGLGAQNRAVAVLPVQGNVSMLTVGGVNIAVQIGKNGVVLVDAPPADAVPAAIAEIRKLTDKPKRLSYPYGVLVNRRGRRFFDEGEDFQFYTYATGRDPSDQWQCRSRRRLLLRLLATPADELDRARLGRIALQQARTLEVREVCVHGRRGGETNCVADLSNGRRIAVRVHVLGEELPDLLLSRRQHRALQSRGTNVCSSGRVEILPDVCQAVGRRPTNAACSSSYGFSTVVSTSSRPTSAISRLHVASGNSPSVWRSWTILSSSPGPRATIA